MKAFLAACNTTRCDAILIDLVMTSQAGKVFPIKFGKLRFWPKTSCAGLHPLLLDKEFLAETVHAKEVSKSHLILSFIFNKIVVRLWLCLSQALLFQGLNVGTVYILILNRSHISWKLSPVNSLPLTENFFLWCTKNCDPIFYKDISKITFTRNNSSSTKFCEFIYNMYVPQARLQLT